MDALSIYVLTFNCARNLLDVDAFANHFFDALPASGAGSSAPDLIFLSLQEIAPIAYSFLGGSYLSPYFDAFRRAIQKASAQKWNHHYVDLHTDNTGMTGLMLFARDDTLDKVAWIDTAHVGVGVQEMGNKGAVGARLGYVVEGYPSKTMDLTFVAAHLAPMEDSYEQRNKDWKSIVERLVFTHSSKRPAERASVDENTSLLDDAASAHAEGSRRDLFAPTAYLFLAGDLNYRTSNIGPSAGEIEQFPRRNVDLNDPSHYSHLLKNDQLVREMSYGRTFHSLSEAPIDFLPRTNTRTPRVKLSARAWMRTILNGNGRITAGPVGAIESFTSISPRGLVKLEKSTRLLTMRYLSSRSLIIVRLRSLHRCRYFLLTHLQTQRTQDRVSELWLHSLSIRVGNPSETWRDERRLWWVQSRTWD
ncbi:Endonuclease/exonuclease/phosphatase [Penicillium cf. griseofulvum]|nr:Endonuclease/exonuclease/phosphatase [Penicillium cf. griseofulvum]